MMTDRPDIYGQVATGVGAHGARVAYSPGRVNLVGDHTDYNSGLAIPMCIDLGTTVTFTSERSSLLSFGSTAEAGRAEIDLPVLAEAQRARAEEPPWARYVSAVAAVLGVTGGGRGSIRSTLPVGAGLSSSAALEVALALALGFEGEPLELARTCQRAEQMATGVPSGLMDQLTMSAAVEGCALLLDFEHLSVRPVKIPAGAEIVVVHCGQSRSLEQSPYGLRQAECEAVARTVGPLGLLSHEDLGAVNDSTLRRRARHVVSECERVTVFADAFSKGDLTQAGSVMNASHRSLAQDFEVSTPALDDLAGHLQRTRGVYGARLTGAGFGGCVVALAEPGALDPSSFTTGAWRVEPCGRARLLS